MLAKFEVSGFAHSGDMERSQNLKIGHVTCLRPPLSSHNFDFVLVPLVFYMLAKFEVSGFAHSGDMEGVPKFQK